MNAGVYRTPDDLAKAGFPTFGRVDGNAVMLDALLEDGYFVVHYCGLAALTKGVEQFQVHKSDLLDF